MSRRLTIPGSRAIRALRDAQAENFPHRGTLYELVRMADPVTGEVTNEWVEGATLPCRINPASAGGLNFAAGQQVVAGQWIVSWAWNAAGLREGMRVLVKQGPESEQDFAELVTINRILRPNSHEAVTITYCDSVLLTV